MKKTINLLALSVLTLLFVSGVISAQHNQKENEQSKTCKGSCCSPQKDSNADAAAVSTLKSFDINNDGFVFACPMNCEDPHDQPGECSKCGMTLKKISVNDDAHSSGNDHHKMMDHMKMDHSKMKHDSDHQKTELSKYDENNDGKIYQCPMKCEEPHDQPGECSKCGMTLKEISVK